MEPNVTSKDLSQLRQRLQEKYEYHKKQMELAQAHLGSVTITLELLEGKKAKPVDDAFSIPPEQLQGLSQIEALKKIARANGGKFRVREAKRLLIAASLIKNPANASNVIYTAVKRSEAFRSAGYGEYELVEHVSVPASGIKIAVNA
jgi:hypothetical protein